MTKKWAASALIVLGLVGWGMKVHRAQLRRNQEAALSMGARHFNLGVNQSVQIPVSTPRPYPNSSGLVLNPPISALVPKNETLREEVARNPHQTPPSLLKFGADIGNRMAIAKRSEAEAQDLLNQLGKCGGPIQIQALCLVSAHELGQVWPDLQSQVQEILRSSSPQTLALASRLGPLF